MPEPSTGGAQQHSGLYRVMEELLRLDDQMPVVQALLFLYVAEHTSQGGKSGIEIAADLGLGQPRVSRNLKLLEDAELIVRHKDQFGALRAVPTKQGQKFLARLQTLNH